MKRFKLLVLLLVAVAFGVLCFQNRQPLSLKLLCPNAASSCWYRTPSLPLALWMTLFVLAGIISGIIWQSLNRFAYASRRKSESSYVPTEYSATPANRSQNASSSLDTEVIIDESSKNASTDYEIEREPEIVRRSGSSYSYKFKDKNDGSNKTDERRNDERKDREDEDWI